MPMTRFICASLLGSIIAITAAGAQNQPSLQPQPQPVKPTPAPIAPAPKPTPEPTPPTVKAPPQPGSAAPASASLDTDQPGVKLGVVAEFQGLQSTGIAVSKSGRVFVCFPRWHDGFKHSLVEVADDGGVKPYPNEIWNTYVENDDVRRGIQFVCVQSIAVDDEDRLWVLDAASPRMEGVNRSEFDGGGPKLVQIDLATNRMLRVYQVLGTSALKESYLNDFQIDAENKVAYISDSGTGAIIVLNTRTAQSRRLLDGHVSTKADPAFVPVIEGRELRGKDGKVPQVHVDGIALDRTNGYLYYQALTGKHLYRIRTKVLLDATTGRTLTPEQKNAVSAAVEDLGQTVMTDGMIFDTTGNLYFSAVERNAIVVRTPAGELKDLVTAPAIKWPDSFAIGPARGKNLGDPLDSYPQLYFTASQIHLTDWFSADGKMPTGPYRVLRTKLFGK